MASILIKSGELEMTAVLNNSATAKALLKILPVEGAVQRWGDEIYFGIPLEHIEDNAQSEVPPGGIAFWPPGSALCVFFGQKPYSPVNVLGMLEGDPYAFRQLATGDKITVGKV